MRCCFFLLLCCGILLIACQNEARVYPEHRVGYIHPDEAISPLAEFTVCSDEKSIRDYYNTNQAGDLPAAYRGGTKAIKKFIQNHHPDLDLHNASGLFTVRFIVNCKGETGRFQVFENNLNYEPSTFHPEVHRQLLAITRALEDWRPNTAEGKSRDSFMYITYRIHHGKITEILP